MVCKEACNRNTEGEKRRNGAEGKSEEITAKNFPKIMEDIKPDS